MVVTWVEEGNLKAAHISGTGEGVKLTGWFGGRKRPFGPINRRPPGLEEEDRDRSKAYFVRPQIRVFGDRVDVDWFGEHWHSDDQGGEAWFTHRIAWEGKAEAEPEAFDNLRVWGGLSSTASATDGAALAIETYHDPNGGPWLLSLMNLTDNQRARAFTSEPAGPLTGDLLSVGDGFVAAWYTPTLHGVGIARLDTQGLNRGTRLFIADVAPGEAGFALAAAEETVRAAFVTRIEGTCAVRLAALTDAVPTGDAPVRRSEPGTEVGDTLNGCEQPVLIPLADGTSVMFQKYSANYDGEQVRALWFDADGKRSGLAIELSDVKPRIMEMSGAAWGSKALAAFCLCEERSMCDGARIHLAELEQGSAPKVTPITPEKQLHADSALAVGNGSIAMVHRQGTFSGPLQVRIAALAEDSDPATTLQAGTDIDIPLWTSDYMGFPALAFTEAGLIVVVKDKKWETGMLHDRVFLLKPNAKVLEEGMVFPGIQYGSWGTQRLTAVGDILALAGVRKSGGVEDAVLRLLSANGKSVEATVTLGRGMSPYSPVVSGRTDGIAVAWYDRRMDGDFLAIVGLDGRRRFGPERLDSAALRASFGYPLLAPAKGPGAWHAFWPDAMGGSYGYFKKTVRP